MIYAAEHCRVPPMGTGELRLTPFEQGSSGGHAQPEMPRFVAVSVLIYQRSHPEGVLGPWSLQSASTQPVEIQAGQRVGTWTPAEEALGDPSTNKSSMSAYLCTPFHDLHRALVPGWDASDPLVQILWKWSRYFSLTKYDVRRTGPRYRISSSLGYHTRGMCRGVRRPPCKPSERKSRRCGVPI